MTRPKRGGALLILAALCAAFAAFVAATGGIDTRLAGFPVRSRSWERPATIAVVVAVAGMYLLRQTLREWRPAAARAVPALLVAWTLGASLWFGTYAAGGADSFGYLSQARLLAHGRLTDTMPRHPQFDWPDVPYTLTPLGYTTNRTSDVLVPIYPPGLSVLMAPLTLIHPNAVFLLVPLCAALTVWLCFVLGRELGSPEAGVLGGLLVAVSPTFLLQAMQPMSDVPVSVLWLSALLLARRPRVRAAVSSGIVASLAILVRPNLAPLALLVAAACWTVRRSAAVGSDAGRSPSDPLKRVVASVAAMIPGVLALGAIQAVRYGSPTGSGYGSFDDLFALSNIGPNLARYPRWLTDAHTPFIWLWLLGPVAFVRIDRRAAAFGWIVYVFAAAVVVAYLPYVYFRPEEWSYTRFLLPALPVMTVLGALVLLAATRRLLPRSPVGAAALVCVIVAALSLHNAVAQAVFEFREGEAKYPTVGEYVRDRLPSAAFVLAAQHSGSVRYYSGRPTLRWDLLHAATLDRAVASLRRAGYEPFAVLDGPENEEFRARFGERDQQSVARLLPIVTIGNTSIYAFK